MARTWLQIQVDLLGGGGIDCDPTPGRVFIVGPGDTFGVRQKPSTLSSHGRTARAPAPVRAQRLAGESAPQTSTYALDLVSLDHGTLKDHAEVPETREQIRNHLRPRRPDWRHRCTVAETKVDPLEEYGIVPPGPVAIFGWGWIPDQYGRDSEHGDPDTD